MNSSRTAFAFRERNYLELSASLEERRLTKSSTEASLITGRFGYLPNTSEALTVNAKSLADEDFEATFNPVY